MRFASCFGLALLLCGSSVAEDLYPAGKPIPAAIDHYVDLLLKQDEITAAAQADDATLIRRLTLDLVGRIPSSLEAAEYVQSKDARKREQLVDRLINSPAFARFQGLQFDLMLASNGGQSTRNGSVKDYLQLAMKDGKPWDKIFQELLIPKSDDPKQKGAAEYLRSRVSDLDRLTSDVSTAFFGVNVSCAQCHDHPLVADWKQDHFYGMKSFFSRTYDANGMLAERNAGLIKFKPTKGPERPAKLMFLTGATIDTDTLRELNKDEQKAEKEAQEKAKASKTAPQAPKFSARSKLVEVALRPGAESEFFAKALVNRLWHRFLGYGLVNPLDQMHSENPPSHPELLQWLAADTITNKYDIRRLIRGIVLSQTYSRSSQYSSAAHPIPKYFAVARLKPLTPAQLGTSLKLAVADPASFEKMKPTDWESRVEQLENAGRGIGNSIAQPGDDFQVGVGEALMFSNSDRVIKDLLNDGGGTLLARISKAEPNDAIELMYKTAYNRQPTAQERTALMDYLGRRTDRKSEAYKQVLWALLTSAEFRFCY
jgi:hypothetical protein